LKEAPRHLFAGRIHLFLADAQGPWIQANSIEFFDVVEKRLVAIPANIINYSANYLKRRKDFAEDLS